VTEPVDPFQNSGAAGVAAPSGDAGAQLSGERVTAPEQDAGGGTTELPPAKKRRRSRRRAVGDMAGTGSAVIAGEPVRPSSCPRWMHHRAGVYCKTCGKT
jgi:hypothetical protein